MGEVIVGPDDEVVRMSGPCRHPGCTEAAAALAYDQDTRRVEQLCERHARLVSERGDPEYVVGCINCGCLHGEN